MCYVVGVVAGAEVKTNAAVVISCFSDTHNNSVLKSVNNSPQCGCSLVITISLRFLCAPSVMVGGMSATI